jgi:prepilin-type N-terminal cleavage/methylation domain-containing protein/prepilin-type processing-associated H-X9-DG protein
MKRRGFTLIELLVVIAIIAILAAILFPVFMSAKESSRKTRCLSNMRQITLAMFSYADDNQGCLPALNAFSDKVGDINGSVNSGSLFKYLGKSKGILRCPSDIRLARLDAAGARAFSYSYTINGWCTWAGHKNMAIGSEDVRDKANSTGFPMGWFAQPRRTILLVDENTDPNYNSTQINDQLFIDYDRTGDKHNKKANVSFLDGHMGQVDGRLEYTSAEYSDGTSVFHQPN